jgi:hypothetical protein
VCQEKVLLGCPTKESPLDFRSVLSKQTPNFTNGACNSCLQTPTRIRRIRVLQQANIPTIWFTTKSSNLSIAKRVFVQRYFAQKCILIQIVQTLERWPYRSCRIHRELPNSHACLVLIDNKVQGMVPQHQPSMMQQRYWNVASWRLTDKGSTDTGQTIGCHSWPRY